ncbi:MAG: diguanylate cyclase, partial [Bacilli bacterium]|nr:diguanylate cyclase [Bacilli bacterium]
MLEKLFKFSKLSKQEVSQYKGIIADKNNLTNAKHELYVLSLGILMEFFLIGFYDIPNIMSNGWSAQNNIYYLLAHLLLFLISLLGTFAAYRVIKNQRFFLFNYIKFEHLNAILATGFLSAIAVVTALDQTKTDSITIYVFFALITGFFFVMKPRFTFLALSVSFVLFVIGNMMFQSNTEVLTSNITNGALSIIVSFFISFVSYNNFVYLTVTTIKLEELTEQFKKMSITDDLTQIYNRRMYEHSFIEELSRSKRTNHPFSIIIFDIDHFKLVNDAHGHAVGDRVLYQLSQHVASQLRLEDTFSRYGGEEFVIILSNSKV